MASFFTRNLKGLPALNVKFTPSRFSTPNLALVKVNQCSKLGTSASGKVNFFYKTLSLSPKAPAHLFAVDKSLEEIPTFKASLSPVGLITTLRRGYATHRDRGYGGGFRSGSRWGSWSQWTSGSSGGRFGGSSFRLLQKPLIFTGAVILFNWLVLPYVMSVPPFSILRGRSDLVIYGLIALNAAGFLLWKSSGPAYRFIYRYGLLQKDATLSSFNKWQMIGSAFSHQELWHIGINMFVLYQFGMPMARAMGSEQFLAAYIDGAVFANLASIALPIVTRTFSGIPSLGASGAVFTVFGMFSYLVPNAKLALFFIPLPIGAWYVFLLTMAYNAGGVVYRFGMSDYAGHLGGSIMGIIWGYLLSEQQKKRREQDRQRLRNSWF